MPVQQLAKVPLFHKLAIGGVGALAIVFLIYRRFGWKAALAVLIGILVVVGLLFGLSRIVKWREKKKSDAFSDELSEREQDVKVSKTEVRQALEELGRRWAAAVEELRSSGLSLYSMPWYLLIGEPQSGKSTTLRNSDLEFPVGTEAISGGGGTRNCDWWFTNEAIVLDTAGRFSFQEKNAPDQEEWQAFLGLLKKHRRQCPINGVIVVVPCTSLLGDSPEVLEQKAQNIRDKLSQVQRVLEIRFPVFLLITKCDIILGFTEFFTKLDAGERRQMFGWSDQGLFDEAFDPRKFPGIFDELTNKVHQLRMRFLCDEISTREVDKLFVFPEEFASLKKPLQNYTDAMFVQTRYANSLFLRGIYFTSGLQQGRPIARACAELLRARGDADEEVVENLEDIFQQSRAFFIRDFYREKVFREQNLVVRSEQALKRDKLIRRLVLFGGGAIAAACLVLVTWGMVNLYAAMGPLEDASEEARKMLEPDTTYEGKKSPLDLAVDLSGSSIPRVYSLRIKGDLKRDLQDIHSALYLKKCLTPLVEEAEGLLTRRSKPGDGHDEFHAALREYIRWYAAGISEKKSKFAELKVAPFVRLADRDDGPMFISQFEVFVDEKRDKGDPTLALTAPDEVLEKALYSYAQQWDIGEQIEQLEKLGDSLAEASSIYREILDLRNKEDRKSEDIVDDFQNLVNDFGTELDDIKTNIKELKEGKAKLDLTGFTLASLIQDRKDNYDELILAANEFGGDSDRIRELVLDLKESRKSVLESVEAAYKGGVVEKFKNYGHIVNVAGLSDEAFSEEPAGDSPDEDASAAEDAGPIGKAVAKRRDPEQRESLDISVTAGAGRIHNFLKELNEFVSKIDTLEEYGDPEDWGEELTQAIKDNDAILFCTLWHGEKEDKKNGILGQVAQLAESGLPEAWKFDKFKAATRKVGRAAIVEWDIAFLDKYAEELESHHDSLRIPSHVDKADGRRDRVSFKLDFLEKTIDDSCKVIKYMDDMPGSHRRVNELLREVEDAQNDFLEKYIGYWKRVYNGFNYFSAKLASAKTWPEFHDKLERSRYDCEDLFDEWPLEDLLANANPEDLRDAAACIKGDWEDKLNDKRFSDILERYIDKQADLEDDCENFLDCMAGLDDSPAKALKGLDSAECNRYKGTRRGGVIERDLAKVSKEARNLLDRGARKEFNEGWNALINKYQARLKNRYPFAKSLESASIKDIKDFLGDLEKLTNTFQLGANGGPFVKPGESQAKFISRCKELDRFLFDDNRPRRHISHTIKKIEYVSPKDAKTAIGREYTELTLTAPDGIDEVFRPAGGETFGKDIEWEPGEQNDRLMVVGDDIEGRQSLPVVLCTGSLSLLAFLDYDGESKDGMLQVKISLQDPTNAEERLHGFLRFKFSQKLPEIPDWPKP